jgi:hypothetical protein
MKFNLGRSIAGMFLLANLLFSQACGKSDDIATALASAGSCSLTVSSLTTCYDYTGSGFTSTTAQTTCSSTNSGGITGTYSSSACSTTGRIGSCVVGSGATAYTIRYLSGYTDTTAQAACTALSGTYTAG